MKLSSTAYRIPDHGLRLLSPSGLDDLAERVHVGVRGVRVRPNDRERELAFHEIAAPRLPAFVSDEIEVVVLHLDVDEVAKPPVLSPGKTQSSRRQ